jgi:hypothetical protein
MIDDKILLECNDTQVRSFFETYSEYNKVQPLVPTHKENFRCHMITVQFVTVNKGGEESAR